MWLESLHFLRPGPACFTALVKSEDTKGYAKSRY